MRNNVHSWRLLFGSLALVLLAASGSYQAQDKVAQKHDAKALADALRDVINQGAEIFNKFGDHAGCYRLYQGALLSVKPFLATDLKKDVDEAIKDAERLPRMSDRAFRLRKTLDDIRDQAKAAVPKVEDKKVDDKKKIEDKKAATLWERLGGDKGVRQVVEDFVATAGSDPKVNVSRDGKFKLDDKAVAALKADLVNFISNATGGPFKYTGKNMKDAHQGMHITDAEYNAAGSHLQKALTKNKVNAEAAGELMKAVEGLRKDIVEGPPKKVDDKKKVDDTKKVDDKKKEEPKKIDDTKKDDKKKEDVKTGSLWDRLGGEKATMQVVEDFLATAVPDPAVNMTRGGKYPLDPKTADLLKKELVRFLSNATGGPYKYTGKSMKEVHKGMHITDAEYLAAGDHLKKALEKNNVAAEAVADVMKAVASLRDDIVEGPAPRSDTDKKVDDKKTPPKKKADDKTNPKSVKAGEEPSGVVAGTITFEGKSAPAGFVTLVGADKRRFSTSIRAGGKFQFKTPIPVGDYKIAIERAPDDKTQDFMPGRYRSEATSGLTLRVQAGMQTANLLLKQ